MAALRGGGCADVVVVLGAARRPFPRASPPSPPRIGSRA
ncbi:hypothetical protein I551_0967 [Mycobacterium ulcerans str. Harvey]|uniref:Uncharacterized protein n=1 Tax=Mycobacterium ulcerans str. Harvey TaxID=1299332 RepID=A0ABP3AN21_MYCUL|nr:hypothetical protein I551_0967 [Mycobacterium ulcerans str. Harvey]